MLQADIETDKGAWILRKRDQHDTATLVSDVDRTAKPALATNYDKGKDRYELSRTTSQSSMWTFT